MSGAEDSVVGPRTDEAAFWSLTGAFSPEDKKAPAVVAAQIKAHEAVLLVEAAKKARQERDQPPRRGKRK